MSVAILGGGLSGLSAAYYLLKRLPTASVTIIESSNRHGGWIRSEKLPNGVIFEQGARTIRPVGVAGTNTLQLIEEIGLSDAITPILKSAPAATTRLIYAEGELHTLPSKLSGLFVKQSPFSKPLVFHFLKDVVTPKRHIVGEDEPIYDFVERRFGKEVADYLISPLICGICAGNAREISVNFLMKSLFEMEQKYGSITRGLIASLVTKTRKQESVLSELAERAKREKWSVYSFKDGVEQLPNALQKAVVEKGCNIRFNAECTEIKCTDKKVRLTLKDGQVIEADHLISSISSDVLGKLIRQDHSKLSELLKSIQTVTVAVVNFSFKGKINKDEAFGFLVAPKENLPILGVIYDSCCFARGDNTVFTVMLGGYWFKKHFGYNPTKKQIFNVALEQLRTILKFNDEPQHYKVNILRNCIPQYTVGHNRTVANILNYVAEKNLRLLLCGSSYYGVGVNDVILSAKKSVARLSI